MNILLVGMNAKYIHSNPALYSLRAYAREFEEHIQIAEYTINNRIEIILADIYRRKPDMIAVSCYIWNITEVKTLIELLRQVLPKVPIYVGGPEVSYDADAVLKEVPAITGVMRGEGEVTFYELVSYYVNGVPALQNISGLTFQDFSTADRKLTDINQIPFLYEDLSSFENRIIYYETSRGCPFACSYCLSSIDKTVRLRKWELVEKELQFFLERNVKQVKFIDRTFNCNHKHAMKIWKYIYEHDNGITNFHFEIAADLLDKESLELFAAMRSGLIQLEIGVQSVNPDTLQEICRTTDLNRLRRNVDQIQQSHNIHLHLDLIAGLPFEDIKSFQNSFCSIYKMQPNQLQLGFLKVLKGSPMNRHAFAYEIVYGKKPPYEVLSTKWLSFEDVLTLKGVEEMLELYFNSGQYFFTLPVLEEAFENAFIMFEKLWNYYEEMGYELITSSRIKRYEILFSFACRNDSERAGLYSELLMLDLYVRENLKNRPSFAPNTDVYKDWITEFYKQEEKQPQFLNDGEKYSFRQLYKMTHLEVFQFDVLGDKRLLGNKEQYAILFDYQRRNPVNDQVRIEKILLQNR